MARWKITAKHYLKAEQYGQPSEWQREEINIQTGRAFRKTYSVPMLIDPEDPGCINRLAGFCVISTRETSQPGDLVVDLKDFRPTPDMEPLDDEAQRLSDAERPNWVNPIDGLSPQIGEDFATQLLAALQGKMNQAGALQPATQPSNEVAELRGMLAAKSKQIETLILALSGRSTASPERSETVVAAVVPDEVPVYNPELHVKDDLDPLPFNEDVERALATATGLTRAPIKAPPGFTRRA